MIRAEDHASLAAGSLPSATGCFASGVRIRAGPAIAASAIHRTVVAGAAVAASAEAPYRRAVRARGAARKTTRATRAGRRIVVIGGGLSGLAAAILLARDGHRVTVLERDVRPDAATPDEAFATWERDGVAQFRHSHTFLARLTCVMRERFPEVLHLLRAHGALELPLTVNLPPGLDLGPRERGDGELVLLGCRRAAFEWALERVARSEPNVTLREGVYVEALVAAPGHTAGKPPRVSGVRVRTLPAATEARAGVPWHPRKQRPDGTPAGRRSVIAADLVVDASGRRSRAAEWLPAIGAAAPRERNVHTGIFYFTRFYRITGVRPPGATAGLVAGDVGWLKLATFPGDNGTFSITVGSDIADTELRALSEPDVFEAVVGAFPQIAVWRAPGVSEPIDGPDTPVLVMGGLSNRMRSFVAQGQPLVENLLVVGDAAVHTNPIYGRGATCALLTAVALADAVAAHPDDDAAAALALASRVKQEIGPFWTSAAAGDRMGRFRAAAQTPTQSGGEAASLLASLWSFISSPDRALAQLAAQALSVYFDHGLVPASTRDGQVYRGVMRVMNMLDEPRTGLLSPAIVARVLPVIARSLASRGSRRPFAGPTRAEALALIERTRAERAARAQTEKRPPARRPGSAPQSAARPGHTRRRARS